MKPSSGFSAFISYASDDREKAHEMCRSLEGRGLTCWIAPRDVRAGREYADEIVTGIEKSACLVVLLSKAANASAFVCREVERAVANHKPIFPVRLEAIMPDGGLELFISGTHWLDAWEGDWHDHMRRLGRDIADLTAGTSPRPTRPRRERRPLHVARGAAVLIVVAALGGFAIWTFRPDASGTAPSEAAPPSRAEPVGDPVESSPAPVEGRTGSTEAIESKTTSSAPVEASPPAPARDARAPRTRDQAASRASRSGTPAAPLDSQPSVQTTPVPGRSALQPSAELDGLRDDYNDLSLRGDVIDDTLNRLWEEMRPLAPRVDIATRQRSLKAALTRAREALDNRDAAAARKYLETARADAAALDEFLGR
jgi:hypothetical protein